jgi:hypothetical protein
MDASVAAPRLGRSMCCCRSPDGRRSVLQHQDDARVRGPGADSLRGGRRQASNGAAEGAGDRAAREQDGLDAGPAVPVSSAWDGHLGKQLAAKPWAHGSLGAWAWERR